MTHPGPYERLNELVDRHRFAEPGFDQLISPMPIPHADIFEGFQLRFSTIRRFQQNSLDVLRDEMLARGETSELGEMLLNDAPSNVRRTYHRSLDDSHWTLPLFYRTDEVLPGRIAEVQCPGSLWGDHQLLRTYYSESGHNEQLGPRSLADSFCDSVIRHLDGLPPLVHHLFDNSSAPAGMRYFVASTRGRLKYFGLDTGLRALDCSLIRSHSFFGLMGENFARTRREMCREGLIKYDHPPTILYGQKISLVLPFLDETRDRFDDEIRSNLIYSYPVRPRGFRLPDGQWTTLEDFAKRQRRLRQYFLKYAGCDVSINWGSRAVFNLGNIGREECLRRLEAAASDYVRGKVWLVQPSEAEHTTVSYFSVEGDELQADMTSKYSGFYGPDGLLGVLVQYRRFYKVHGQPDTVASIITPGPPRDNDLSGIH